MEPRKKEKLLFLLEEVRARLKTINYENPDDSLMDLGLVMEDLRLLYREVELLKMQALFVDEPTPEEENLEAIDEKPEKVLEPIIDKTPDQDSDIIFVEDDIEDGYQEQEIEQSEVSNLAEREEEKEEEKPATLIIEAPKPEPATVVPEPEPIADDLQQEPSAPTEEKEPLFVADKLKDEDNSIYNKFLSQNHDNSIGTRLQMSPVSNLKDSIGINEKFIFINELFAGNLKDYNEAIEKLNGFGSSQEALEYLEELKLAHGWNLDRSEKTIETLVSLVQRRYIAK